jgi:hypothetical protein
MLTVLPSHNWNFFEKKNYNASLSLFPVFHKLDLLLHSKLPVTVPYDTVTWKLISVTYGFNSIPQRMGVALAQSVKLPGLRIDERGIEVRLKH